jgi:RNA polymerase sigma-32 factor
MRSGAAAEAAYLDCIRHQPYLSAEEEAELARRAGAGDAGAERRLICAHLRFVVRMARAYRAYGLPMADLIQEGTVGLIRAVRRYDPSRGARLATFAMWSIRAALQEHVVSSWSLVRLGTTATQRALFLKLRRLSGDLMEGADALGDEVMAALAQRFGVSTADVVEVAERAIGRDRTLADTFADPAPSPEDRLALKQDQSLRQSLVAFALALLPEREAIIIRRRYLTETKATFAALAGEFGLSKDRVRQLEGRALARLRDLLPADVFAERGRPASHPLNLPAATP